MKLLTLKDEKQFKLEFKNLDEFLLNDTLTELVDNKMVYRTFFVDETRVVGTPPITKSLRNKDTNLAYLTDSLNNKMKNFISKYNFKDNNEKHKQYRSFSIPKRHGGWRHLIDPSPELKSLQKEILSYLQDILLIYHHNSAHAFRPERDACTNAQQHKQHKCIIELDFHDFFGSVTKDLLKREMERNYKLWQIKLYCSDFIDNIIEIATLDDVLPQGSPLSPFLSNLVMCYFDYLVTRAMKENRIPKYTYTRYADDMTFSANQFSSYEFHKYIEQMLIEEYPTIKLNQEKTKYLKNTVRCYVTGVKINKDNNATFGWENKKKLKLDLFNLFQAYKQNEASKEQVQEILGMFAWMNRIEPNYAKYLERKYLKQFNSTSTTLSDHFKPLLK